jgi:hypothetical protein
MYQACPAVSICFSPPTSASVVHFLTSRKKGQSAMFVQIEPEKRSDPNTAPRVLSTQRATFGGYPEATGDWVTCPDDPGYHPQKSSWALSYIGIAGLGADAPTLAAKHPRSGVFGYDRTTKLDDIIDGTSQTMMLIETTRNHGAWTAGGPSSVRGCGSSRAFTSAFPMISRSGWAITVRCID